MRELKIKLKRGGVCVGYMRIKDGDIEVAHPNFAKDPLWGDQYEAQTFYDAVTMHKEIAFDSIHPFVCQDRNGRDVYEGDTVRWFGRDGAVVDTYTIVWQASCVEYVRVNSNEEDPYIDSQWIELLDPQPTGEPS